MYHVHLCLCSCALIAIWTIYENLLSLGTCNAAPLPGNSIHTVDKGAYIITQIYKPGLLCLFNTNLKKIRIRGERIYILNIRFY